MQILSRLVKSWADRAKGQQAQPLPLQPEDLRMMHNLSEFKSGLRHLIGSAIAALLSGAVTAGLLWTSWETGQAEAAFFAGFTAMNTYWMIVYCRAVGDTLFCRYRSAYSRAEDMNRENIGLRKRLMTDHLRRQEGEADGAGGAEYSPSASRFRRIPLKGEVQ